MFTKGKGCVPTFTERQRVCSNGYFFFFSKKYAALYLGAQLGNVHTPECFSAIWKLSHPPKGSVVFFAMFCNLGIIPFLKNIWMS